MTATQRPMTAPLTGGGFIQPPATLEARPATPPGPTSTASDASIEGVERIQPIVARWAGAMASLWTYSITHGKLVIRLTRPTAKGNLHLTCFDCRRICAPTFWGATTLQITEESGPEGRRIILADESNKVEIRCGHLVLAENVEPIF